jgi:von Willebrand factor type A domain-containing protein
MRQLLLAVVPIACTVSAAAPSKNDVKIATDQKGPIIEHGEGCGGQGGDDASIAADAPAPGGGYRGRGAGGIAPPPPSEAPATRAPRRDMPADKSAGAKGAADSEIAVDGRMPPMEQSTGVRAGEWDDNANYRDYVRWLQASPIKGKLDIAARQFLVVADAAGKPVPNCTIDVAGAKTRASLVTMASGRAVLFPHAMGFGDEDVVATAMCPGGGTATAKIATKDLDGVVKLALGTQRALPAKRTVDLAFVLDTTGSMAEEITAVKQTISAVASQLSSSQTDVRIGLVEYKDRSDCLLTRTFPFSSDLTAFGKSVANITADGGGDMPEDMHAGLNAALDKLQWRSDAVTRMVVVIADAPPHMYPNERLYDDVAKRAASRGIKLYTVAASGMDDLGQVVMRQMAQFTGASNMFVLRGGAGPQSVGGGDPKSSCGGTHDEYASGKLDQLIMRKVRQELASLDADPMKIPGRGQDENAKPCSQRLVLAN